MYLCLGFFFCDTNRNKNARKIYVMLEIPGFWYLLIHRRWLHLIRRAAEWRREAVWKQLSFSIKIFKIKEKKKKSKPLFSGSKYHRWVQWPGKCSRRNLFSPHGKVTVVGSWILLFHVTHRSVQLAVSSRGNFLPSSLDSKYRVNFYIFVLQV